MASRLARVCQKRRRCRGRWPRTTSHSQSSKCVPREHTPAVETLSLFGERIVEVQLCSTAESVAVADQVPVEKFCGREPRATLRTAREALSRSAVRVKTTQAGAAFMGGSV